jgi:8-oxo-dGTP diphosphatase
MASIGAFGIILCNDGRIVLVRHKYGEQKLSLPGGGIEAKETPDKAGSREILEEIGIHVDLRFIGMYFLHKSPGMIFLFEGKSAESIFSPDANEIEEIVLVYPDNLPPDVYPAQKKLIDRWRTDNLGDSGSFHLL